jgi:hypothetical protein
MKFVLSCLLAAGAMVACSAPNEPAETSTAALNGWAPGHYCTAAGCFDIVDVGGSCVPDDPTISCVEGASCHPDHVCRVDGQEGNRCTYEGKCSSEDLRCVHWGNPAGVPDDSFRFSTCEKFWRVGQSNRRLRFDVRWDDCWDGSAKVGSTLTVDLDDTTVTFDAVGYWGDGTTEQAQTAVGEALNGRWSYTRSFAPLPSTPHPTRTWAGRFEGDLLEIYLRDAGDSLTTFSCPPVRVPGQPF